MSRSTPLPFEELEHTADLCLRVRGQDLPALFVNAAQGMFWLMRCRPSPDASPMTHELSLKAFDAETLLVDWLNELLYLSEAHQICYNGYEMLHVSEHNLQAQVTAWGPARAERGIKAATFSSLSIERLASGEYVTTIVFDV